MVFFGRKDSTSNSSNVPLNTVYALKGQKIYDRQVYCYLTQINTITNTVIIPGIGVDSFISSYMITRQDTIGQWWITFPVQNSTTDLYIGSSGDCRLNIKDKTGFRPNTRLYIEFVYEVDPVTKFNKKWV